MAPVVLTSDQFHRIARAIADPTRFHILRTIYASKSCTSCTDSISHLSISAATASHHLRELESADLITVTREGRFRMLTPRRDIWRAYLAQLRAL